MRNHGTLLTITIRRSRRAGSKVKLAEDFTRANHLKTAKASCDTLRIPFLEEMKIYRWVVTIRGNIEVLFSVLCLALSNSSSPLAASLAPKLVLHSEILAQPKPHGPSCSYTKNLNLPPSFSYNRQDRLTITNRPSTNPPTPAGCLKNANIKSLPLTVHRD